MQKLGVNRLRTTNRKKNEYYFFANFILEISLERLSEMPTMIHLYPSSKAQRLPMKISWRFCSLRWPTTGLKIYGI
eukprot:scaffold393389_cov35-Attheya_sp.AAC.1